MNAWLPQASYPCGTVVPSDATSSADPRAPALVGGLLLAAASRQGRTISYAACWAFARLAAHHHIVSERSP